LQGCPGNEPSAFRLLAEIILSVGIAKFDAGVAFRAALNTDYKIDLRRML